MHRYHRGENCCFQLGFIWVLHWSIVPVGVSSCSYLRKIPAGKIALVHRSSTADIYFPDAIFLRNTIQIYQTDDVVIPVPGGMLNWFHAFSALIRVLGILLGVWALRLPRHKIIFQSRVSTVKFLIVWFFPLPLALVVKYLSNKSVRKVKHIYKVLKLFSQWEPCTLWSRIL